MEELLDLRDVGTEASDAEPLPITARLAALEELIPQSGSEIVAAIVRLGDEVLRQGAVVDRLDEQHRTAHELTDAAIVRLGDELLTMRAELDIHLAAQRATSLELLSVVTDNLGPIHGGSDAAVELRANIEALRSRVEELPSRTDLQHVQAEVAEQGAARRRAEAALQRSLSAAESEHGAAAGMLESLRRIITDDQRDLDLRAAGQASLQADLLEALVGVTASLEVVRERVEMLRVGLLG